MEMTFRWYGETDRVTLAQIRQIPGVTGIVSALYDIDVGAPWPLASIERLAATVDAAGLRLSVIESSPVHEDIKLGRPSRDRLADHYCTSIEHMGRAGVDVLCYNFMPVFDWTRTALAEPMADGSTTLSFDEAAAERIDLSRGTAGLPGWAASYDATALAELLDAYRAVPAEQLWENLAWFLERVVPVAASAGVRMGSQPDDPPWPVFGLPRIITDAAALRRLVSLVDSPSNGVTFCTGSLGALPTNDLPVMARVIGGMGRISFAHCRNVAVTGHHAFRETPHPSRFGDVDMHAVLRALHDTGYTGPMRPDHGRMIWSETGRAGYGLCDRALGAVYLQGLWEGITRERAAS